jgi:hypothetical protein
VHTHTTDAEKQNVTYKYAVSKLITHWGPLKQREVSRASPTTTDTQLAEAFLIATETAASCKRTTFRMANSRSVSIQQVFDIGPLSLIDKMVKEFSILKFKVIEHEAPITNNLIPRNGALS